MQAKSHNQADSFNSQLLVLARKSRGITQKELAERIGVSQGRISKIEDGLLDVTSDLYTSLERALGYPISFYFRDWDVEAAPVHLFRRRATTKKSEMAQAVSRINIIRNHIRELVSNIDRKPHLLPRIDPEDVEGGPIGVAQEVRIAMRLSDGPVDKLIKSIERTGVLIVPFDFQTAKIDACCDWIDDIPIIFLNLKACPSRMRFSLAHELGHLVMHQTITDICEDEADDFASEFLMPNRQVRRTLLPLNLTRLGQLKIHWKVSMQALLVAASRLGVISQYQYKKLYMELSAKGYRRTEPFEDMIPREEPLLLKQLIGIYTDKLDYTYEDLARKLSMFENEIIATYSTNMLRVVV